MSSRKEMIQCKDSIVILRSIATKNLYKSIRRQILDCTAFVFLFLARHSPSAAFGSQGKRFFTSFRMTKGLGFGSQPAGHARRQPDVCGPPRGKAATRTEEPHDALTFLAKPLFAFSAAFLRAIALSACCRLPQHDVGSLGERRHARLVLGFVAFLFRR